jgi:Uma2 family endonuclease
MATVEPAALQDHVVSAITLADALDQLGNIPAERILYYPALGTATEEDVLEVERRTGLAPELIDGILVEKAVGYLESRLAVRLILVLEAFVETRKLGIVLGEGGALRILANQVRVPDVCYISREKFPGGELPDVPIPGIAPDLAVEILSRSNTRGEMQRKLHDYFTAGVRLVWYIDPRTKTCRVYTSPDDCTTFGEHDTLDGGDLLPGFTLKLTELFGALKLE